MEKNFSTLFSDIKKDLTAYITLKLSILKLETYEKLGIFSSILLYGLAVLLVVFFAFLFLLLALGLFIGSLLSNFIIGITLIATLYIIILCILLWKRTKIQNWLMNMFVEQISQEDKDEKDE